jgi:hypothetical protein
LVFLTAVTVKGVAPAGVAFVVVIVKVEVRVVPAGRKEPQTSEAGTKSAVTPAGNPDTLMFAVRLKVSPLATVTR